MRKRIYPVLMMLCLLLAVCTCTKAEALSSGNGITEANADIRRHIAVNIQAEPYLNDLKLDIGISSIAVSPSGETAVISKASNAGCDFIISVYSPEGQYLFGHKIKLKYPKGKMQLFYSEGGELCFRCPYVNQTQDGRWHPEAILTFNAGGIGSCYEILNPHTYAIENITEIDGTKVYISPQSAYRIEKLDSAYLSIRNIRTGEITEIYDHSQANAEFEKELQRGQTVYIISLILCVLLAAPLFRKRCN